MAVQVMNADLIAQSYKQTQDNFFIVNKKPPKRSYRSLEAMLKETVLLGNFKLGNNFIG